jgi:molybdopterin-guanine dinucleotide biosynthesis protein A
MLVLTSVNLMLDGFVLAGGKSSRMGTDKAHLQLGGVTFAERAVSVLRLIAGKRVYFVENEKTFKEDLLPEVSRVFDVFPERGALGGIHAALSNSRSEWAAVLACDFPFVTGDLLKHLAQIAENENAAAVAPIQSDGRPQPLCALYRVEPCLQIVCDLLAKNSQTPPARILLEKVETRRVKFQEIADLPGAGNFFFNVNSLTDFQEAEKILELAVYS